MSSVVEISDDDESFEISEPKTSFAQISSDSDETIILSDEDIENQLPQVHLKERKSAVIKKLFPTANAKSSNEKVSILPSISSVYEPKKKGKVMPIAGIEVEFPVDKPYSTQTALINMMMKAMKNGQNCLLESPTGTGKTLALLCGALAWQAHERKRIAIEGTQEYLSHHPELKRVEGLVDHIASPLKPGTPVKLFEKTVFGERSIYDKPGQDCADNASANKRIVMDCDSFKGCSKEGEVSIHKRIRLGENGEYSKNTTPSKTPTRTPNRTPVQTPEKIPGEGDTPPHLSLPIIYYGARTHKQLQQVIKEFKRTTYCGIAKMTILSSRDHSCVREFDRQMYGTKNDMCRACTKKIPHDKNKPAPTQETNCVYYDNRMKLNHDKLPPAFDIEELVEVAMQEKACPYYAARYMAQDANIVFCPYDYLIDPNIRSSMGIDLENNIVIIDEAHNIEDKCRDAATFKIGRDQIIKSLQELEVAASYRYASSSKDVIPYVDHLVEIFKTWNQWFHNQMPLLRDRAVINNETDLALDVDHFITTLNNHNIGEKEYQGFYHSAEVFNSRFRESPGALIGVSQDTVSLIEDLVTVLGYLFREGGRHKNDFKPVLLRTEYNDKESIYLRLLCMNSAIVFAGLKKSRCIVLSSGTLTPMGSLHSELGTEFKVTVSCKHVIPKDRVWVGTLATCPDGSELKCTAREVDKISVQTAIGEAVKWVCEVTPHGVLCFVSSYKLMNTLLRGWEESGIWSQLNRLKNVFIEERKGRDHDEVMRDFYETVSSNKGALLFAVYRGKVAEGMDFKDHQARAVITIGIPYPSTYDTAVREKMEYNSRFQKEKKLLDKQEWLRVQAYRALNQALGRCVRHVKDWGAVLLIDSRFGNRFYTEHLSRWIRDIMENNHHTFESLMNSENSLATFMRRMALSQEEEDAQ